MKKILLPLLLIGAMLFVVGCSSVPTNTDTSNTASSEPLEQELDFESELEEIDDLENDLNELNFDDLETFAVE